MEASSTEVAEEQPENVNDANIENNEDSEKDEIDNEL